jgi:hypothetical protein
VLGDGTNDFIGQAEGRKRHEIPENNIGQSLFEGASLGTNRGFDKPEGQRREDWRQMPQAGIITEC